MSPRLTYKQKRFCQEYMVDFNATQAAIRAEYSQNAAKEIGYENLTKPHVLEYLAELKAIAEQKTEDNRVRLIKDLENQAFSDFFDFCDFDGTTLRLKAKSELTKDLRRLVKSIKPLKDGGFELKLHDKDKAVEKLMKHLQMYNEDSEVANYTFVTEDHKKVEGGDVEGLLPERYNTYRGGDLQAKEPCKDDELEPDGGCDAGDSDSFEWDNDVSDEEYQKWVSEVEARTAASKAIIDEELDEGDGEF